MEDIILIGGGGHCKSVIDTIQGLNQFNIIGIVDLPEKIGFKINNVEIIGTDEMLGIYFNRGIKKAFITLGSTGDPIHRKDLYHHAKNIGFSFPVIVDTTAIIGKKVELEEGIFVGKGCIINTNTQIGKHSIINTGSIIEHDCKIGKFSHIAPGTTLSGGVLVGDSVHIGTNTTIIQNINIGSHTLIGAGSVVVKDIGENIRAYGNPCREV